jgi:hypothetical protein
VGVLQRFERRVEQLVNGAFAKAFKSEVQPVEIASALQRECDDRAAIVARGRTMVPNSFVVELGPTDHERLALYAGPLGAELADMVREHAEEQHYAFVGPVSVTFEEAADLDTGMFRVRSAAVAAAAGPAASRPGAGRPYLEVNGAPVALAPGRTTIGRAADSDIRIDDPGISRRHAEVRMSGSVAVIVDVGSTNGIVVNGRRTHQEQLSEGTRVQLGSTTIVFHAGQG